MSIVTSGQVKATARVTDIRAVEDNLPAFARVTNTRAVEDNFKAHSNIGTRIIDWCPRVKAKAKIRPSGFFDSMFPAEVAEDETPTYNIPTRSEMDSFISARVFIQAPDLGIEKQIGYAKCGELYFDWGINQEILWELKLIDFDRSLISPASEWSGYLTEGIYSYSRATRKYLKFEICAHVGDTVVFFTLPRLVIKEIKGEYTIHLAGWDEITEVLTQEISLPTFCAREALGRIDARRFLVSYLTHDDFFDFNRRSELYVNFQRRDKGFTYDTSTKIVSFNADIDEHYIVMMINPISKKWALNNICRQCIDLLPSLITKEYFNVQYLFAKDTYFYNELTTINTEPRETMKKILDSIPADYLIMPVGDRLSLLFMDRILQRPTSYQVRIPETLYKGKADLEQSSVASYNEVDIKKYSAVYDSYRSVEVTS